MQLEMRDLPPFITDENGHIPMYSGETEWLVVATREALQEVGCVDPVSDEDLRAHVDILGQVASFKLSHGRQGSDGQIWVLASDVVEWRSVE